jgi:hypothetical protein
MADFEDLEHKGEHELGDRQRQADAVINKGKEAADAPAAGRGHGMIDKAADDAGQHLGQSDSGQPTQ